MSAFQEINRLIRIGEVRKAISLTVEAICEDAAKIDMPPYSEILRMPINSRRGLYFAALKLAAAKLDKFADEMLEEAKKMK